MQGHVARRNDKRWITIVMQWTLRDNEDLEEGTPVMERQNSEVL